ncbi:MAG: DNA polymerase I, partial [Pseudomonadota bacterium]
AVLGVLNMLLKFVKEQQPAQIAVVFDAPGRTFRDELFAQYKAHRPPMPDELRAQVEPMIAIVEALGFPILRVPGVEADDVIGTLAARAVEQGMEVLISTGDKDFAQLVGPHVTLVNTMTGTVTGREGVIEKFGVPPDRITDFLALQGDSIDNIPGVEKCGPKTAAKWLAEYDTLEDVIANADQVGGKIGDHLRAALPRLPLSKQLATIRTDVDLPLGPRQLNRREPDTGRLRELYLRYGFIQALKEIETSVAGSDSKPKQSDAPSTETAQAGTSAELPPKPERHYDLILDQSAFDAWLERLRAADAFAFDTETTSLDAHRAEIVGVSFSCEPGRAAYVPLAHDYPGAPAQLDHAAVLAALKPLLEDPAKAKIGQHGKYDMHVLANYCIALDGYAFDTMLESYVWNSTATRHDMDSLADAYLGEQTIHYEDVAGKGAKQINFAQVDVQRAGEYAAEDADITFRLHRALWPKLESEPALRRVFEDIEMPLVPVLARMERRGVLVDVAELKRQSHALRERMHALTQQAYEAVGHTFSLDSPKQLQQVLFQELGLPIRNRTPTGQPSTNEDALAELADDHALPKLILDYRMLAKLVGTYTEKLPEMVNPDDGRVHTSFHQAVAATGRLSSSDPNLQNIPIRTEEGRRIRTAFVAPEGWTIVAADYSQIELRIMAHLSGDPGLTRAFREGLDVHRATAAEVFGIAPEAVDANQRRAAKAINFGLMYGMSAHGLSRQLGIPRHEAQEYMDLYFARFAGVRAFMDSVREKARRDGYVETVFGRRLYLPEIRARSQAARAGAERAAINAPMQGTAADIIKRAMIAVDGWLRHLNGRAAMILQVHDELVLEVRDEAVDEVVEGLVARMTAAAALAVPLDVDVGRGANWDRAH